MLRTVALRHCAGVAHVTEGCRHGISFTYAMYEKLAQVREDRETQHCLQLAAVLRAKALRLPPAACMAAAAPGLRAQQHRSIAGCALFALPPEAHRILGATVEQVYKRQ
jgi:hypothetical protein